MKVTNSNFMTAVFYAVMAALVFNFSACKDDDDGGNQVENETIDCCAHEFMTVGTGGSNGSSDGGFYAANIFTPNNDGINDKFVIFATTLDTIYSLKILDSDDSVIFEQSDFPSNDITVGWDGRNASGEVLSGIFKFELIIKESYITAGTVRGMVYVFNCDIDEGTNCDLATLAIDENCIFNNQIQTGMATGLNFFHFKNVDSGESGCQ